MLSPVSPRPISLTGFFRFSQVMFREAKTFQDKVAAGFVKFLRYIDHLLSIILVPSLTSHVQMGIRFLFPV